MKSGEKNPDKELYKQLRTLSCEQLWEQEVPRFDRATPEERLQRVALVRAIGVVFSESGTDAQRATVRPWLHRLLHDPAEKIRRYAMAALPKIGAGPQEEAELLALLRKTTVEREKKFLGDALHKIGGSATLEVLQQTGAAPARTVQKVKANVARSETPSVIRLDRPLADFAGLTLHLRGRRGLEEIVRQEVQQTARAKFRLAEVQPGLVAVTPIAPFSLGDVYALRCFATVGVVLGEVPARSASPDAFSAVITSPRARAVLAAFTEGPVRYRLEFIGKGHQRGAVREIADRAFARAPELLNDARNAPWAIEIHPAGAHSLVELRPRLSPDPRLWFRRQDVPAASHPPLAAAMARLGRPERPAGDEVVWDPFCGSGLELIERCLLGGVRKVHGTDRSGDAIVISKANFAAAKLRDIPATFTCCDFRDFAEAAHVKPGTVTLILTNPPMGKRVPIRDLHQLIADLFTAAATMLRPGGRLVFANPLRLEPTAQTLRLLSRRVVDLGGFDCRLEVYEKVAG